MPPSAVTLLDHVAIALPRAADATPFLVGSLGARPLAGGPGIGFRWWQWTFAGGGVLELLEPDGPPGGFAQRFLASRGPGVHHVTFKVPVLDEAVARAEALGYDAVGHRADHPSWKEAFLHPRQAQGIVVQLAESHPELEPEEAGAWPFPASPPPAARPSALVGLRLAAADEGRTRRQWQDLLGGRCRAEAGALVFRWPGSALRIAVEIGRNAPEGPRAIEVDVPPGAALPESPHPVLGTRFAAVDAARR